MASEKITFEQVGRELPKEVVNIPHQKATLEGKKLKGTIVILDVQYGDMWTNMLVSLLPSLGVQIGDKMRVVIYKNKVKNMRQICHMQIHLEVWQKTSRYYI